MIAAGGSSRLGRPKQLLPYGRATLLDHVLGVARRCDFDQVLCVIGGDADGRGHPLVFARSMFGELSALHGDKGVWRLLDRHGDDVVEVPIGGQIPRDIDTWDDYQAVVDSTGAS